MSTRVFSSLAGRRSGLPIRLWFEIGLLLAALVALQAVEPINQLLVRDVVEQSMADQRLSHFSDEIVVQTLLCRRFEKDILLNLDNPTLKNRYLEQWNKATADLARAIEGYRAAAVIVADRAQAEGWRIESEKYRAAVLQTLEAVDSGTITRPTEANSALSSAKRSIRALTEAAMAAAHNKEVAVQSSSDAMRSAVSGSTRVIMLMILVVCVIFTVVTRQ